MIDEAGLDAVVIATPTPFHKPMAVAALRRGLHVIGKALTQRGGGNGEAKSARADRQRPGLGAEFRHVRRIIASGKIGGIVHVPTAC